MVEEEDLLKDGLVGLLEVVSPEGSGKFGYELHFFFDVEELLDVGVLLDVVVDPPSEGFADVVLVNQLLEDLHVLALLDILRADVGDE
jgi:hypothetical protein